MNFKNFHKIAIDYFSKFEEKDVRIKIEEKNDNFHNVKCNDKTFFVKKKVNVFWKLPFVEHFQVLGMLKDPLCCSKKDKK